MPLPDVKESWRAQVNEVTLGATADEGGTRDRKITLGGAKAVPYMDFEGDVGNRTVIAMDVLDAAPEEWPAPLAEAVGDVAGDPAAWAKKCIDEWGADLVCLKLDGVHPDRGDRSADDAVKAALAVRDAVKCPLVIWCSGDDAKDNEVMPKVSQALAGERCLLGTITEDNYKVLTATCLADGHCVIGEAPLDINIGKQVNILASDMGFPLDRLVMYQTTGALGYGLEYAYSIQERARLAALDGDKMMQMPVAADVGHESWRAKEAKAADKDAGPWGPHERRGPMWEFVTAVAFLQSGVDLLRMRHPKAVAEVKKILHELYAK
jgi:acetyl-CoA decarbonylase/synthase complex subunit delta